MDEKNRKEYPVTTGVIDFFPNALLEIAHVSYVATQQHHPGQPMHWDKSKSKDEADALVRHLIKRGTLDTDGLRHSAKVAWRSLSLLERELTEEANENISSQPISEQGVDAGMCVIRKNEWD